ncbi:transposable element Tcb1 transposase [Trichonephila clavipes]|nr:transposable element Tcb1 transposase [Trichonephila clavipes]
MVVDNDDDVMSMTGPDQTVPWAQMIVLAICSIVSTQSTGHPRVTTPNENRNLAVTAKRNRWSTASDFSRQLSSATGTTVSRQTVYRLLGQIGLYARRPVFSPDFNMECARYPLPPKNTIERYRYGGAEWLVWGEKILGSRTGMHVQSVTMTGHIYRDVILEQHVRLFRGAMGAEFLFMDDNARLHRANIVDECLQSEDITRMDWPAYSQKLNPIQHVWDMLGHRIEPRQPSPTCLLELRRVLLDEWCNIPQDQIDNLILSLPRRCAKGKEHCGFIQVADNLEHSIKKFWEIENVEIDYVKTS